MKILVHIDTDRDNILCNGKLPSRTSFHEVPEDTASWHLNSTFFARWFRDRDFDVSLKNGTRLDLEFCKECMAHPQVQMKLLSFQR